MAGISAADPEESIRRSIERGGKLRMAERKVPGRGRDCAIEDLAGAVAALFQPQ